MMYSIKDMESMRAGAFNEGIKETIYGGLFVVGLLITMFLWSFI